MQQVAPGCVGDGSVVFECFGDGLVGAGGADGDDCAVCMQTIEEGCGPEAMGLPCRHLFHRACLEPWWGCAAVEFSLPIALGRRLVWSVKP
jgi:hypothetical protein